MNSHEGFLFGAVVCEQEEASARLGVVSHALDHTPIRLRIVPTLLHSSRRHGRRIMDTESRLSARFSL